MNDPRTTVGYSVDQPGNAVMRMKTSEGIMVHVQYSALPSGTAELTVRVIDRLDRDPVVLAEMTGSGGRTLEARVNLPSSSDERRRLTEDVEKELEESRREDADANGTGR